MRQWGWDFHDLRRALADAHRVERRGRTKYEFWVRKRGSKKLVAVYDAALDVLVVVTATEG